MHGAKGRVKHPETDRRLKQNRTTDRNGSATLSAANEARRGKSLQSDFRLAQNRSALSLPAE